MVRAPRASAVARLGAALGAALAVLGALLVVGAAPAAAAGPTFTFNGGGFGHGLGMSQYGALGQANAGASSADILGSYYSSTQLSLLGQPGPKVHLGTAGSTTLTPDTGKIGIYIRNPGGYSFALFVNAGQTLTVTDTGTDDGGRFNLAMGSYNASFGLSSSFVYIQIDGNPTRLGMTGQRYRWGSLVLTDGGGVLEGIAYQMTMQEYLYGLAEVPSSWPAAALQAQAIAGRTYAKAKVESRSPCPDDPADCWNMEASTYDQVFAGYEKVAASFGAQWAAAVNATDQVTVTYSGQAIQAFYSSSSGGYTENSEYVFVTALPYIRAVPDPGDAVAANPNYRWSKTFDGDQLGSLIGGVGQVSNVEILGNRGASGRIDKSQVRVTGSAGTKTITGSQLQVRLGLRSTLVLSIAGATNTIPFGALDAVVGGVNSVAVQGWAIDPDVNAATEIDVWADGGFLGYGSASQYRSDVATAYPAYGGSHGFSFSMPIAAGSHSVCVFAIDINEPSTNRNLGCRSVSVAASADRPPFGNFEATTRIPGGVSAQGWAIDPDTTAPIEVDAYVDGKFAGYGSADRSRPDVGQAYPGYGPNHGFDFPVAVPAGSHSLCLYGINAGGGVNPSLGCRTVTVTAQPFGNLDLLARSGSTAQVQGWAIDPDTAAGIEIDVLVNGVLGGYGAADRSRPDVGQVYPRYGSNHGFTFSLPIGAAPQSVCVYAINAGAGYNVSLGCRSI